MGEYIALGKAEAVLKNCIYVENIVLHGNSYHNHLIALIQPSKENVLKLAESMNLKTENFNKLCDDAVMKRTIIDELIRYGRSNGLLSKEIPYVIKLCTEQWTPNNNLLTASMKTRRNQIYAFYQKDVEKMYKELESIYSSGY